MGSVPRISVCIPSYNHARFLPATLDAILGQTCRDFEIVVVDDGSTDDSMEILKSYACQYPKFFRIFTHPDKQNHGISATVNLALEKARGVYWCGHPSDDVSYHDRLERQLAYFDSHPSVAWIYGVADLIDEQGALLCGTIGWDLSSEPDLVEHLIWGNNIMAPTTMARREYVQKVGKHDENLVYSDWEFWVRFAALYQPAFFPRPVVQYRMHGGNTSVDVPRKTTFRRRFEVMTALRSKAAIVGGQLNRQRTKAQLELSQAYCLFHLGAEQEARQHLAAAFRTDPSLRHDSVHLAQWLCRFDRGMALAVLEELGWFGSWLASPTFIGMLFRVAVYRPLRTHFRGPRQEKN